MWYFLIGNLPCLVFFGTLLYRQWGQMLMSGLLNSDDWRWARTFLTPMQSPWHSYLYLCATCCCAWIAISGSMQVQCEDAGSGWECQYVGKEDLHGSGTFQVFALFLTAGKEHWAECWEVCRNLLSSHMDLVLYRSKFQEAENSG